MAQQKKIDIIIPAYHAQSTIARTLGSLVMQTIIDQCTVYICNDAGGDDYKVFVDSFSPFMDVHEIVLPQNGGGGVARQYGIDNSTAPFFMCMDADDTLAGPFALITMLKYIEEDPKNCVITAAFLEELPGMRLVKHDNDMIWMHGKLYRRSFIDKYHIDFDEGRSNEDNGFNKTCLLCSSEEEKVVSIPDVVYFWHYKEDSITRINNYEYTYNQSFIGYTDEMIHAIKRAREEKPFSVQTEKFAVSVMAELYIQVLQTIHGDPRFADQNIKYAGKYYREIFEPLSLKVPKKDINVIFADVLTQKAAGLKGIVPDFTIHQFITQLAQDSIDLQIATEKAKEAPENAEC